MSENLIKLRRDPLSEWQRLGKGFISRPIVIAGLAILAIYFIVAILAPVITPYNPYKQDMANPLLQPSSSHWLGTDNLGRDTLSRLIYGTQTALLIGFITVGIAGVLGTMLGMVAGYLGGAYNQVIMRCTDAIMSLPPVLLALIIASLLGGGIRNIIVALSIATVCPYIRVMCAQTLSLKENDYILMGKAMGASNLRIMLMHILPNSFPAMIVLITLELGNLILAEAALSFLGIGIEPPGAAWGSMINDGIRFMQTNSVLSVAPGAAIMLLVFGFNMVGDGMRDTLDPRLRNRL
jgi:peptide/nickel transport system permease protein